MAPAASSAAAATADTGEQFDAFEDLPPIPEKRYFAIGEVSDLCAVKPHVLRYWEQEFPQLRPVKRRGNRRYYQQRDVMLVRQIRHLLYDKGFTIGGARQQLQTSASGETRNSVSAALSEIRSELEDMLEHIIE